MTPMGDHAPSRHIIIPLLAGFFGFASIHAAAWYYGFPSVVEAWMWRICSICLFALPIFYYSASGYFATDKASPYTTVSRSVDVISTTSLWLFPIARLMLVALTFVAFGSAPVSVYEKVNWTSYWGHIGT